MMSAGQSDALVSVLVTVYNREKYLSDCLESILKSTHQNFELIVVDDKSTDGSVTIVQEFVSQDDRIRLYINPTNLGDYPNRNRAAELAVGKYLKYVDSDDMIEPDCLSIMVRTLDDHPEAAYVLSYPRPVDQPRPLLLSPERAYHSHMIEKQGFFCSGPLLAMIRTDRFREVGGFRPAARNMGDAILWMELSTRWPMLIAEDSLTFWRQHDQQEYGLVREHGIENARTHCMLTSVILRDFLNKDCCPLKFRDRSRVRLRIHFDNFRRVLWHLRHFRLKLAGYELGWAIRSVAHLWPDSLPSSVLLEHVHKDGSPAKVELSLADSAKSRFG